MPQTPVTPDGLEKYDGLPACRAAYEAWINPGKYPQWHRNMQAEVRKAMPLLARALDRMTVEE